MLPKLETPVVMIVFHGDLRKKLLGDKFIYLSMFDELKEETSIIIKVQLMPMDKRRLLQKEMVGHYKKFGLIKSFTYSEKGMQIIPTM